jgi:hypothetical protein
VVEDFVGGIKIVRSQKIELNAKMNDQDRLSLKGNKETWVRTHVRTG